MDKVFVYGTLMRGNSNHKEFMQSSVFIAMAVLTRYALHDLGEYPCIVPDKRGKVLGELYDVNEVTLKMLDILEDEGDLYLRKIVAVQTECGRNVKAYTYVWNGSVVKYPIVPFTRQPWTKTCM